jgi:xanthine dehydrogenase accessory factor
MLEFYRYFAQRLAQAPVVLATVIQIKGSVPREVGAKMIIQADGQIYGTIGGGAGEAKVIQQALEVLQTGEKRVVEIDLTGAPHRETQGICGGTMRVWLERWSGEDAIALLQQIIQSLEMGRSLRLITPFSAAASPCLAPTLAESKCSVVTAQAFSDTWIEMIQPPPSLLIVGAGHVGMQLAKVAHLIGFQVAIQDDRAEWANPEHYPQASLIITDALTVALEKLATHAQLYVALVTRGFQYDLAALSQLLDRPTPCDYIGMIGSEKRVRQVYQALLKTGISLEKLQSIYAPIGLDIGALTPVEIAVSISAELILVRRGGTGRSLSESIRQSLR